MIKITIRTTDKRNLNRIEETERSFKKGIRKTLYDKGNQIIRYITGEMLKRNKTGKTYIIDGRIHTASAPGEFPAKVSGRLIKSLDYKVRGDRELEFGSDEKYAGYLEKGTRKMKARPFLSKGARKYSTDFKNSLLENVDREIKK